MDFGHNRSRCSNGWDPTGAGRFPSRHQHRHACFTAPPVRRDAWHSRGNRFHHQRHNPNSTAKKLGWPTSPWQIKYGFQQLGLGVIGVLTIWFQGNFWAAALVTLYIYGVSGLWTHTQEVVRKRRETGVTDWVEIGNIVFDVIYHVALTWTSLLIPGVWSLS